MIDRLYYPIFCPGLWCLDNHGKTHDYLMTVGHSCVVLCCYIRKLHCITVVTGFLLLAEQLGGAVVPTEQGPSPAPPSLFREVGPSVDEWEKYLRNMAEDLEKSHTDKPTDISSSTRQEDNIFLQVDHFWFNYHHSACCFLPFLSFSFLKKEMENV